MKRVLGFLFPNCTCFVCLGELNATDNGFMCVKCAEDLSINTEPLALADTKAKKFFKAAHSAFVYDGLIVPVILRLKYGDNAQVAEGLYPYMVATLLKTEAVLGDFVLVPVPLCKKRYRKRGYNQAELLANHIAEDMGLVVDTNVLVRTKNTAPQKQMSVKERQENLRGAFAVKDDADVQGKKFLIVDDVFTSGTTVNECARVLKQSGAKEVHVIVLARVVN
ncbi:MAG: ComF family protein [Firmicutes bacterium]|nr:ComF family protein [Bacillota bacterium]